MIVDVLKRYLLIVWNFFFGQVSSESIQDGPSGAAKRDDPAAASAADSSFGSAEDKALEDGEEDEVDEEDDDDVEVVFDDDEEEDEVEDEDVRAEEDKRHAEPVPPKKLDDKPAGKTVDVDTPPEEREKPKAADRPEDRVKPKAAEGAAGDGPAVAPPRTEDAPKPKAPADSVTAAAVAPERKEDAPKPKPEAPEPPKKPAGDEARPQPAADDAKTPEKVRAHVKFEDEKRTENEDPNARFVRSEKGGDATKQQLPAAAAVDAFLAGEQKRAVPDDHRPSQQPAAQPLERPESIQDQTL